MHSFLRAIGFSGCDSKQKEEALIDEVLRAPMYRGQISVRPEDPTVFSEVSLDFGEGFGITVRGQVDEDNNFHMDHYFPYLRPRNITSEEELFIGKRSDSDSFAALCDDMRVGVSLIFFLNNAVDFLRSQKGDMNTSVQYPTRLSALAADGHVLLPTVKSVKDIKDSSAQISMQKQMISEAKNGNQEAIDKLTIQEIDMYSLVGKRIKEEDVFSIVDTSFAPFGMESEIYKILGIIVSVEERQNRVTDETVYVMEIYCNHMIFDLCINSQDLLGVPEVGRRFRGAVWLQGAVDFPK